MIYKFENEKDGTSMEVELVNEKENVNFWIEDLDETDFHQINLNKGDVYNLIGALHFLHKQMK